MPTNITGVAAGWPHRYIPEAFLQHPEQWRSVPGFDGIYEVSSWSRVRAMPRQRLMPDGRKLFGAPTANGPLVLTVKQRRPTHTALVKLTPPNSTGFCVSQRAVFEYAWLGIESKGSRRLVAA